MDVSFLKIYKAGEKQLISLNPLFSAEREALILQDFSI